MFLSLMNLLSSIYCFALHIAGGSTFPKPLSAKEEAECLQVLQQKGDDEDGALAVARREARDKLISHNLRLVAHVIKKYYSTYSDQDDLISIGTIGLIKGINSFDPAKGTRLATYAARCIENEILMYFRSQKNKQQYSYMSDPIDVDAEGNPLTIIDVICSEKDVAEDVELKLRTEQALSLVECIRDPREKQIIIMRYGLDNSKPLTQREVAKKLGISRSYVSRIEKKVLEKLRKDFK